MAGFGPGKLQAPGQADRIGMEAAIASGLHHLACSTVAILILRSERAQALAHTHTHTPNTHVHTAFMGRSICGQPLRQYRLVIRLLG
jgi:hypothetical protein